MLDDQLYRERRNERQAAADVLARQDRRIANLRLVVFAALFATAYLSTQVHLFGPVWIWGPVLAFAALMMYHQRVLERLERAQRAVVFYEDGLRRLDGTWPGHGLSGDRYRDPAHPYSADLDVFGEASLFELLCTARTRPGEDRLAAWLSAGASAAVVRERQEAVKELTPRLDLREDLAVLGKARGLLVGDDMTRWAEAPRMLPGVWLRLLAVPIAAVTLVAFGNWLSSGDVRPLAGMVVLEQLLLAGPGRGLGQVMKDVRGPLQALETLLGFVRRLETETFSSPLLTRVVAPLSNRPAQHVARLLTLVQYLEAQDNVAFKPIGSMMMWSLQFGYAVENWRERFGGQVRAWVEVVAEVEALLSLANHAYEYPEDPFPQLDDGGRRFDGDGLGHPLLPVATCVRNDVRLDDEHRVYVVSGSNMSGKSSLLRTVGTNAVLALAGAPVRATRLHVAPLALGASLLVSDSLREGLSRFYAEITRLRRIMDMSGQEPPLLFLLDEMLQGTNSYDRGIGAQAVIAALVERGAIGLVTTHDLNLTHIVDTLAPRASNVHFEDQLDDGKMSFDYRLRTGVVEKSNAVALMRAVGLPV